MGFLQGKVALVTGAGSGIGRDIALAYAREGAAVLALCLRPPAAPFVSGAYIPVDGGCLAR